MSKFCDRCDGMIVFVKLDTGGTMPVDPVPVPDGNVAAKRWPDKKLRGHVISAARPLDDGQQRYRPHFASCEPTEPLVPASQRAPGLFDEEASW